MKIQTKVNKVRMLIWNGIQPIVSSFILKVKMIWQVAHTYLFVYITWLFSVVECWDPPDWSAPFWKELWRPWHQTHPWCDFSWIEQEFSKEGLGVSLHTSFPRRCSWYPETTAPCWDSWLSSLWSFSQCHVGFGTRRRCEGLRLPMYMWWPFLWLPRNVVNGPWNDL